MDWAHPSCENGEHEYYLLLYHSYCCMVSFSCYQTLLPKYPEKLDGESGRERRIRRGPGKATKV